MSVTGCRVLALLAVAVICPLHAGAQWVRPLSLDMSIGPGYLGGGPEVLTRGSIVADGLLSMRLAKDDRGGLLAGMSVGWQGPPPSGDKCVPGRAGQCLQDYDPFTSVGILVGWTSVTDRVRVLGGMAIVRADHDDQPDRPDYTVGVPLRVESVLARFSHVAAVVSLRVTLLPRYRGDAYTLLASGVGFRIH